MNLDRFSQMQELESFLSLRGLKIIGRKQVLVARSLNAYENNAPLVETAEEAEANIAAQNNLKLVYMMQSYQTLLNSNLVD